MNINLRDSCLYSLYYYFSSLNCSFESDADKSAINQVFEEHKPIVKSTRMNYRIDLVEVELAERILYRVQCLYIFFYFSIHSETFVILRVLHLLFSMQSENCEMAAALYTSVVQLPNQTKLFYCPLHGKDKWKSHLEKNARKSVCSSAIQEKSARLFSMESVLYEECRYLYRPWYAASSVSKTWSKTIFQFTFVSCFCLFIEPNKSATKLKREAPETKKHNKKNSHIFGIRSLQCNAFLTPPPTPTMATDKMQFTRETKAFNTSGRCSSVRASDDFFVC